MIVLAAASMPGDTPGIGMLVLIGTAIAAVIFVRGVMLRRAVRRRSRRRDGDGGTSATADSGSDRHRDSHDADGGGGDGGGGGD